MTLAALTALTGNQKVLWYFVLVVGVTLIVRPYWQDWRYGKYRPTRQEYYLMPAAECKRRMRDPKFKRYIDHLFRHDPPEVDG